jgi:hypothetical protein
MDKKYHSGSMCVEVVSTLRGELLDVTKLVCIALGVLLIGLWLGRLLRWCSRMILVLVRICYYYVYYLEYVLVTLLVVRLSCD